MITLKIKLKQNHLNYTIQLITQILLIILILKITTNNLKIEEQDTYDNREIKIKHFPMKITKVSNNYITMMLKALNKCKREKDNTYGSEMSRQRLAAKRRKEELEYSQNVSRLVYQTNLEFHSSAFAAKMDNLLNKKWTEKTNSFIIESELTPLNEDRVHRIMMAKYGRFAS